jgi:hypothetical protein
MFREIDMIFLGVVLLLVHALAAQRTFAARRASGAFDTFAALGPAAPSRTRTIFFLHLHGVKVIVQVIADRRGFGDLFDWRLAIAFAPAAPTTATAATSGTVFARLLPRDWPRRRTEIVGVVIVGRQRFVVTR